MNFAYAGTWDVHLMTSPALDNYPGRDLSIALAVGDQSPQVATVFKDAVRQDESFLGKLHYKNAGDNARIMRFKLKIDAPGKYDLKLIMVDPTILVQKIILAHDPLPDTYFGPPSRPRNAVAD